VVVEGAQRCGLDGAELREALRGEPLKLELRAATDAAIARGVTGVPTIAVGEQLFWGDDRLEDAARALAAKRGAVSRV
jgi:2-hydroxychromene-2-carboxylate isomerase